jgi:peptidoglycan/xylan/chitin deacetylase (PgdA/CDA1 family)
MALKHTAMRHLGQMANASGLTTLATRKYGGAGAILTLHSVVGDDDPLPMENVHTSARFLEKMIRYYLARRIPVLALSDALAKLEIGSTPRFVCFTFDDGYRDNLTLALPIFKKYGLPFTIYVTSAYLERNYRDYWWGQLRHLVRDNSTIVGGLLDEHLPTNSWQEKIRAYRKLVRGVRDGTLGAERLAAVFEKNHITATDALDRDALSVAELAAVARAEPLVEIGGHTTTHTRLSMLDESGVLNDLGQNKRQLESIIQREVRHFAYPFGDSASCGERDFRLANAAGFKTAVTTRIGNLFQDHLEHRFALPRLRFIGPCESLGFMESQRSGAVTALETRFGNPVRVA